MLFHGNDNNKIYEKKKKHKIIPQKICIIK